MMVSFFVKVWLLVWGRRVAVLGYPRVEGVSKTLLRVRSL